MFQTIEKLRAKPEGSKKKIAFLLAFLFSGIIFVVWLSVIFPDFKNKKLKESEIVNTGPSPISAFSDTLSSAFLSMGEQISNIKGAVSKLTNQEMYYSATSTLIATTSIDYTVGEQ